MKQNLLLPHPASDLLPKASSPPSRCPPGRQVSCWSLPAGLGFGVLGLVAALVLGVPHPSRLGAAEAPVAEPPPPIAPPIAQSMPGGAIALLELNGLASVVERFEHSELLHQLLNSGPYKEFAASYQFQGFLIGSAVTRLILRMDLWTFGKKFLGRQAGVGIYPREGSTIPDLVAIIHPDPKALASQRLLVGPALWLTAEQLQVPEAGKGVTAYRLAGNKTDEDKDEANDREPEDDQEDDRENEEPAGLAQDKPASSFLALHKEWVVYATNEELLRKTLVRLTSQETGAEGSVAGDEAFQLMSRQMGTGHHARLFVQNSLTAKATGRRFGLPEKLDNPLGSLLAGGILELAVCSPYTGVTLDFKSDHFLVTASLGGDPKALEERHHYAFSDFPASGTMPLPRPADLIGGFTIYRDIGDWYLRRDDLIQAQVLPEFDKFETGIGNPLPGKDIGQDVLPLLGNTITFLSAIQQYDHLDGAPGVKLPGFALIIELEEEEEASDILQLFFQTLLAVLNIQAGEQDRQPWLIETEMRAETKITFARYLDKPTGERLPIVFNFLPASARVGRHYVVSSSLGFCRQIVDQLQTPEASTLVDENLNVEFAFDPFVRILESNRDHLLAQRVKEGRSISQAESDIAEFFELLGRFGAVKLSTRAGREGFHLQLKGSWK